MSAIRSIKIWKIQWRKDSAYPWTDLPGLKHIEYEQRQGEKSLAEWKSYGFPLEFRLVEGTRGVVTKK